MNKQLLQRNESSESLQLQEEGGSHASTTISEKSSPSSFSVSKKYKVLLLVIGVLVVIAVCAAVAVAGGASQAQRGAGATHFERRGQLDDPLIDMATKEQLLKKVLPSE